MKRLINYFKYAPVYRHVVVGLMAIVVFVTTYALILPAISLEWEKHHTVPGLNAAQQQVENRTQPEAETVHEHDESCYVLVPELDDAGKQTGVWKQVLNCGQESAEQEE